MDISLTGQIGAADNFNVVKGGCVSRGLKGEKQNDKALKEACQGFEEVFLNIMMKSMRSTIPEDGLFGKSQGMDIYTSMHDQYLAETISKGENSTGVGEYLYRQLQNSI